MMLSTRNWAFTVCIVAATTGCPRAAPEPGEPEVSSTGTRSYRMGFSVVPPKPDIKIAVQSLERFYRSKNLKLVVTIDVTNGLGRETQAPALVAARRSITEPAVQRLYRDYVGALVQMLRPDYLGLAAETNMIRVMAPRPVYSAVVKMANDAAADIRRSRSASALPLYASVQVEAAWGKLPKGPLDYYTRVRGTRTLPVMVVEGGWPSSLVRGAFSSSPQMQSRYLARHAQILDEANAVAVFQLMFTDVDVGSFPKPVPAILPLFATLGLVDTNLGSKPALSTWDKIFARRLER